MIKYYEQLQNLRQPDFFDVKTPANYPWFRCIDGTANYPYPQSLQAADGIKKQGFSTVDLQ